MGRQVKGEYGVAAVAYIPNSLLYDIVLLCSHQMCAANGGTGQGNYGEAAVGI